MKTLKERKEAALATARKVVKNHTFRRRVTKGKKVTLKGKERDGKSFKRQIELLEQIKNEKRVFISTHDVEMAKWRFKEATSETLVLVETEHERIYKATL